MGPQASEQTLLLPIPCCRFRFTGSLRTLQASPPPLMSQSTQVTQSYYPHGSDQAPRESPFQLNLKEKGALQIWEWDLRSRTSCPAQDTGWENDTHFPDGSRRHPPFLPQTLSWMKLEQDMASLCDCRDHLHLLYLPCTLAALPLAPSVVCVCVCVGSRISREP